MAFPVLVVLLLFVFPTLLPFTIQDAVLLDSSLVIRSADIRGLALVSLDLVLEKINDNREAIVGLLTYLYGNEKATKYAMATYQSLDSKAHDALDVDIYKASYFANMCKFILDKSGISPSPLGPRNDNVVHLTQMAMVLTTLLDGN
ncbi:hypothetical protein ACLOJK_017767 [Asimina triloba]